MIVFALVLGTSAPCASALEMLPADLSGTTSYSVETNHAGDVILKVPLLTPAGVRGHGPKLEMVYSSADAAGNQKETTALLGYGWGLSGISEIRRCWVGQSGTAVIRLDNLDALCLDGARLIKVSGSSYWADNAVYRTESNTLAKVVAKGVGVNNRWFEVYTPDGRFLRFGDTANSRPVGGSAPATPDLWSLTYAVDDYGNTITVSYGIDTPNRTNYPTSIVYGAARVDFYYESRNDLWNTNWMDGWGELQPLAKRTVALNRIAISLDSVPLREYRIRNEIQSYGQLPIVQFPPENLQALRVAEFQVCGYDESGATSNCQAPLQLAWGTKTATIAGVTSAVDALATFTDSVGASTSFEYEILPGSCWGSSCPSGHALELDGCPYCSYYSNGPTEGSVFNWDATFQINRLVVAEMNRSDGIGGARRTTYQYDGYPLWNTVNRGFVGFPAMAVTEHDVPVWDPITQTTINDTITTYTQHRLDFPFIGSIAARKVQASSKWVSEEEFGWKSHTASSGYSAFPINTSVPVVFAYQGTYARWDFEANGQTVSAQDQNLDHCFRALSSGNCPASGTLLEYPTQVKAHKRWGASLTTPAFSPTKWGDVRDRAIVGEVQYNQEIRDLTSDTTNWVIGFPAQDKAILDTPTQPSITRTVQRGKDGVKAALKTFTAFPGDAVLQRTVTHTFDTFGNITSTADAGVGGLTTRTTSYGTYEHNLFPLSITNPKLDTTALDYDTRFGQASQLTDRDGVRTWITYDPVGRIASTETENGTVTTYDYASCLGLCSEVTWADAAELVTVTQSNGGVQTAPERRLYFDILGRTVLEDVDAFDPSDGWRRVETHFDTMGRVSQQSLPYLSALETPRYVDNGFDFKGQVIREDRPDGSYRTLTYTGGSGQTTVDVLERVLTPGASVEDQTKRSIFNAFGQLTSTTDAYGTALAITTAYTYDAAGDLDVTTVNGVVVANIDYDIAGNKKQIVESNSGTTRFAYDAFGQLKQATNGKGQISQFSYDALSRLTQRSDDVGGATAATYNWTWDPTYGYGEINSRSRADGTFSETSTYTAQGQIDTITTSVAVAGFTSNTPYIIDYDYANGLVSQITYPSAVSIGYDYTAAGYLAQVRKGTQVLESTNQLDAFGTIIDQTFANQLQTVRDVDPNTGRLTAIQTGTIGVPTAVQNLLFTWRSNGALFERTDLESAGTGSDDRTETATYDALNRLVAAASTLPVGSRTLTFAYDLVGNLTSKTSSVSGDLNATSYTYGTVGKPHRLNSVAIRGVTNTLAYDLNGSITQYDAVSGDDTFISYDGRNQATKITVGASSTTPTPTARDEFWYDPDGQRFLRKATWNDNGTQRSGWTLYLQGGVFEEVRTANTPTVSYYQKLQVSENVLHRLTKPASGTATTTIEFTHRDQLGSVVLIADATGNVLNDLAYDPFGGRREADWSKDVTAAVMNGILADAETRTARGFTDHEMLDRTSFVHMNGRTYDPRIGRFLQSDPVVSNPTLAASYNRYSYTSNQPLSRTDPSGYYDGSYTIWVDASAFAADYQFSVGYLTWLYGGSVLDCAPCSQMHSMGAVEFPNGVEVAGITDGISVQTPTSITQQDITRAVEHFYGATETARYALATADFTIGASRMVLSSGQVHLILPMANTIMYGPGSLMAPFNRMSPTLNTLPRLGSPSNASEARRSFPLRGLNNVVKGTAASLMFVGIAFNYIGARIDVSNGENPYYAYSLATADSIAGAMLFAYPIGTALAGVYYGPVRSTVVAFRDAQSVPVLNSPPPWWVSPL